MNPHLRNLENLKLIYPEASYVQDSKQIKKLLREDIDYGVAILRGPSIHADEECENINNHKSFLNIAATSSLFQNTHTDLWLHESWSVSHFWRFLGENAMEVEWNQIPLFYRQYNNDVILCEYLSHIKAYQRHSQMAILLSARHHGFQLPVIPAPYTKIFCNPIMPDTDNSLNAFKYCIMQTGKQLFDLSYLSVLFRQINIALQMGAKKIYICGFNTKLPAYYTTWGYHNSTFRSVVDKGLWDRNKQLAESKFRALGGNHPITNNAHLFLPLLLEYIRQIKLFNLRKKKEVTFKYMGDCPKLARIFYE